MSTKVLDHVGWTGAFHHIIRRKAVASDTGLNNLKKVQAKVMYLPLSRNGECLKRHKEQKEQLSDLVPDFLDSKTDSSRKRKASVDNTNSWNSKRSHYDSSSKSSFKPRYIGSFQSNNSDYKKFISYDSKGKSSKDTNSSFWFSNKRKN